MHCRPQEEIFSKHTNENSYDLSRILILLFLFRSVFSLRMKIRKKEKEERGVSPAVRNQNFVRNINFLSQKATEYFLAVPF